MEVKFVWFNRHSSGKLVGFANILFGLGGEDGCVRIDGFKVFKNDNGGYQVATPSRQDKNGEYYPLVKIDVEKEEGKALLDSIQAAVVKQINYGDAKQYSDKQETPADDGIAIDDLPF
jgi:DNA-binding cell septation regulator SpoVG